MLSTKEKKKKSRIFFAETFRVQVPIYHHFVLYSHRSLLTTNIFQSHCLFFRSLFYVMWAFNDFNLHLPTTNHQEETNENSLPFLANKLDFYSTPLARSRYLPLDGSFFCFESCRIKARFKLIFFFAFAHFFLQYKWNSHLKCK